ncbi:MAG TPA: DUF6270 domain-containing protein [Angustibacter sp.]|nr:DUF6270 domain-containing protein [Angustibacter sp.]
MKLAIWGSCVTRDVLEVGDHGFELEYHARTSWVSQAAAVSAPPVPVPQDGGFGHRMVREDLTKQVVAALVAYQPRLLVLDLIDERFDVVQVGASWYSMADYYTRLGLEEPMRAAASATSAYRSAMRAQQFRDAVSLLAPELAESLPQTRIVLHQAWYTARSADLMRPFYATATQHARTSNDALAEWYGTLRRALGRRLHVVEPPRELLVGDPDHRWGLAHYHYVPEYYSWMLRRLQAVAEGPRSALRPLLRPSQLPPDVAQFAA